MRDYIWAVEHYDGDNGWIAFSQDFRPTRARARRLQKFLRETGDNDTRVVRYVRDETSLRHWNDSSVCQCDDCTRARGE